MQILKCLNILRVNIFYYDYLNFMGTLQQGNRLGILLILVIVFQIQIQFVYVMRKLL